MMFQKQDRTVLLLLLATAVGGCAAKRLDLGADALDPWPVPPRSADGRLDETTPFVVVPHQEEDPYARQPFALATDGTRLVWMHSNGVRSCVIDNCRSTLLSYDYSSGSNWLGIAGAYVWWGMPALMRCPIEGCPSDVAGGVDFFLHAVDGDGRFALDDAHVYWSTGSATVLRCPLAGCAPSPELVALLPTRHVVSIVIGANDIVVATWGPTDGRISEGHILAVPKDGSGKVRDIVKLTDEPTSLAIDGSRAYWTTGSRAYWTTPSDGTVRACPLSGCTGAPALIATAQRYPVRLAVDDRNAYWINPKDNTVLGEVMECPLDGCGSAPKVLASGQPTVGAGLVLDATHVYWTNEGFEQHNEAKGTFFDGDIRRVGK
jgi:hypothetical protein